MATTETPLDWRENDVPVSQLYDDPYYSVDDGLAETAHVFVRGNDLEARLVSGFRIAELGFGTGLNLLAVVQLAEARACPVRFTSFEAHPLSRDQMARALAPWAELGPLAAQLLEAYRPQGGEMQIGQVTLDLHIGLAQEVLPVWEGMAQAWFLDGFSPARNPELWSAELMAEVARHTAPGGTFATYTSAGHVRRSLSAAGFDVRKVPGFARKREMSIGQL